jgi:signal transduction histidine kinase
MSPSIPVQPLDSLRLGDHLCCFYETEDQYRAVLTYYVHQGLAQGERVLCIVDAHPVDTVLDDLRGAGVAVDNVRVRGQLRLVTAADTYLRGGRFRPAAMFALLQSETEQALAEGYMGLRAGGELTWATRGLPGCERLLEYEVRLNTFLPGSCCMGLCQYDLRRFDLLCLLSAFMTHPRVLVGTAVYENIFFRSPNEVLTQGLSTAAWRYWFEQLAARQQAEAELERDRQVAKQLARQLVDVRENERRDLARELHDEAGQALTGLKLILELLPHIPPDTIRPQLEKAQALVDELIAQVRELSLELRPAMLDELGLMPALQWYVERYQAQTQIAVSFQQTGLEGRFAPAVETALYRVVQEALTNIARHAQVRTATVRLWADTERLHLEIADQGVGFDAAGILARVGSSGLTGMRERMALAGGSLQVESSLGAGTRVTADIPLAAVRVQRPQES